MNQTLAIPADLDCSSWPALEPLYRALIDRTVGSEPDFWDWLRGFSALHDVVSEYCDWRSILHTCHTNDPVIEQAYKHVVEQPEPQIAPLFFALQKKFLADSHAVGASTDPRIAQLVLLWQADVDAYREENIPLQVRATNLASVYDKTCGAMTATFQGAEQTLQQLAKHLDDTDRSVRETAWELIAERHLRDEHLLNETFDELIQVRDQMARNASPLTVAEVAAPTRHGRRSTYRKTFGRPFMTEWTLGSRPLARSLYLD